MEENNIGRLYVRDRILSMQEQRRVTLLETFLSRMSEEGKAKLDSILQCGITDYTTGCIEVRANIPDRFKVTQNEMETLIKIHAPDMISTIAKSCNWPEDKINILTYSRDQAISFRLIL